MTPNAVALDNRVDLRSLAQQARWQVIKTVMSSKAGHIGGPLSMMDLLVCLYFGELNIRLKSRTGWTVIGSSCPKVTAIGLYAVLALRGFLPIEELVTFDQGDSRLQGHPDLTRLPGLDASTGSLGRGLSLGVGMALGAQLGGNSFHTWVMLGDGEIQEDGLGGGAGGRPLQAR